MSEVRVCERQDDILSSYAPSPLALVQGVLILTLKRTPCFLDITGSCSAIYVLTKYST